MTTNRPKPSVALIGSRGVPANYGGYETLMEELSRRLVDRGWDVTVYCRSHSTPKGLKEHQGAKLVVLPTIKGKYTDTPIHTLLSCLHAATQGYDAALVVNSANAMFLPLLRLGRIPVALNVDGIEKRRAKWGLFGRAVYAVSERLSTRLPTRLVTDAEVIRSHYQRRYGVDSWIITYGVSPQHEPAGETLRSLNLESRKFFLYVSRFELENNPHKVVEAYRASQTKLPLVMVGGAPYADKFIASFTQSGDPRILFPGPIYGRGYRELLSNAYAYIQATEVGGTHPALVEAMGYGNCLLVNETPENAEVAGDSARYFSAHETETLTQLLEQMEAEPDTAASMRQVAAKRAASRYDWDKVTEDYHQLFSRLALKS